MGTLYVMVGIPGSGKSTTANQLPGTIISSDLLREEIYGNTETFFTDDIFSSKYDNWHGLSFDEKKVIGDTYIFEVMYKRTGELLKNGDVIYDATNHTAYRRIELINHFKNAASCIIAVYLKSSENLELCLERNQSRARKVPDDIIRLFYDGMEKPTLEEGFDEIMVVE